MTGALWIAIALVVAVAVWLAWELYAARQAPADVQTGVAAALVPEVARDDVAVARLLSEAVTSEGQRADDGPGARHHAPQQPAQTVPTSSVGDSPIEGETPSWSVGWREGAVAGALVTGVEVIDYVHVDGALLDAVGQLTHETVHNGLDLWQVFLDRDYALGTAGFETMLRGHLAEAKVFDQLGDWAGGTLEVPFESNNPDSDLSLQGQDFNIKVGTDSSTIAEHLQEHPDIPLIVNEDMAGLPDQVPVVDLSAPLDADVLAEHSIVMADGLTLADLHGSLADALGPVLDSFNAGDLLDTADVTLPGLGTVVYVIRSGIRESRLVAEHGQWTRAAKNIGQDAAFVGTGVVVGSLAGHAIGGAVDVLSGGATMGSGTVIVGAAGALTGGWVGKRTAANQRREPLRKARKATTKAVRAYETTANAALVAANRVWQEDIVPAAQRDLAELEPKFIERIETAVAVTALDLGRAQDTLAEDTLQALRLTRQRMEHRPAGLLSRGRRQRWFNAADAALEAEDPWARLDVSMAAGGDAAARRQVDRWSQRRALALLELAHAAHMVASDARDARSAATTRVLERRESLAHQVRVDTYPAAFKVWRCGNGVRKELVATGLRSRKWVKKNLPSVPAPPEPSGARP